MPHNSSYCLDPYYAEPEYILTGLDKHKNC